MKYIFTILCFLFTFSLSAQEICNNGVDDDGDLLIDLNDTVDCSCTAGTPPTPVSIIPNPSFEQRTCCPSSNVDFNCVSTWSAMATPDYFNQCGYISQAMSTANLNTFPDGSGCVGALFNSDYKEYITSCLTAPMLAGNGYTIKFNVASLLIDPYGDNSNCGFNNNFGAVDLTVYGKANCSNLAAVSGATNNCISVADTSWKVLGTVNYNPLAVWGLTSITFTPSINISAIALGSPCNLPAAYPPFSTNWFACHPYFLFDNLMLNTSDKVSLVDIKATGHYCTNNVVLKANVVTNISSGANLQWYHDGVALVGQTSATYSVPAGMSGVGNYQVQVSNGGSCVLSPIYQVTTAQPVISVYNPTICPSVTYNLLATCPVATTFTWSTGAISNTTAVNPNTTTVYTVSGTYGSCLMQNTPTVTVMFGLSSPLGITASTLITCPGSTLQLNAQNATGIVNWTDGGHGYMVGSTSSQSVILKPYSTNTYYLNSVFSNPLAGGTSCQANAAITISVIPTSVSVTPNNIKICPGRSITLTASGASSYTWNSSGANSNTILVTPTVNTTYTVTGNDGVCTVTNTAFIRADSAISVFIGYDDYPCAGYTSTLAAYGASSYTWSNGTTGSQTIVSPATTTTYSVVGSTGYCTSQYSVNVNVFNPALIVVSGNRQVCSGQTSTLTVASPVPISYYTLESPSAPIVYFHSGQTYVTPSVTTTYTITSYISGMTCAPVSIITVSMVSQPPVSVVSPTICMGQSAFVTASGASSYTWATGQTTSAIGVTPTVTSTYTVTGSTPGCAGTTVKTATVFVNPLPAVSLDPVPVLCDNGLPYVLSASPANGIFTGTGIVSNSSFDPTASGSGTFVVNYSYTDGNRCDNSAAQTVTISVCTGITEHETSVVSISPNPATSILTISTNAEYQSVKIINLAGKVILKAENKPGTISISALSNGVYFIQLLDRNNNILKTEKFIKN